MRVINSRPHGERGRPSRKMLILTEGQTEEYYFKKFFVKRNSPVKVIPIHVTDHSIVNAVEVCCKKGEAYSINIDNGDRLVIVLDVDLNPKEKIVETDDRLNDKGYKLHLSNPSFEYWLVLHFIDLYSFVTQEELEQLLSGKQCLNRKYEKGKDVCSHINEGLINEAVARGEKMSKGKVMDAKACVEKVPSTTMHILTKELSEMISHYDND